MKRILLIALCVVVALAVAAGIVIATYDYNKLKPQIENAFREATGRRLTLGGNIDLKLGLSPTLVVNDARLSNAPWGSRPDMAEIKRFEVQLALVPLIFRSIEMKRVVLVEPDILIETSPTGESNLDFLKEAGTAKEKKEEKGSGGKVSLTVNEMRIRDGRLTYKNGKTHAAYALALPRFDASAKNADSPIKLTVEGSYNGRRFQVAGTAVPLAAFSDAGRAWPLDLKASIADAKIGLKGSIKDLSGMQGIDLKVTAKGSDVEKIGGVFGVSLPLAGALDLSCRVTDPRPKVFRITDLKMAAGGSDVAGTVGIDLSRPRFRLSADVRSKRIDLRSKAGQGTQASAGKESARGRVFPDSPLPLGAFRSFDAEVVLGAGEVLVSRFVLRNVDMRATLAGGRLAVKPLKLVLAGGSLGGVVDLTVKGTTAVLAVNTTVKRLDVGALFRELGKSSVIEGHADAMVDASGSGTSVAGIMSTLSGKVYAIMGEGKINNKYMGVLGTNIFSGLLRMVNPLSTQKPVTTVSCVVCGFVVRRGIAEATALVVNSDYMSVVGNGTVNLRTEGLDLSLKPIAKEGIGTGLTGKISLSLGELTRPFKLAGTLSHPSLAVDFRQTALTAAKALGGLALFGPAGLGGALLGTSSTGDKQLCPLAIRAAQQGVKLSDLEKKKDKSITGKAAEGAEDLIGGVKKGLKKLFGR